MVFLSLLCLSMNLRASTSGKVYETCFCSRIAYLCGVETFADLRIHTLLQQLLPAFGDLNMELAFLFSFSSIWRGGSCAKHTAILRRLFLLVGSVTAGLAISWWLLWMALAHSYNTLKVACLCHSLLLVRHCQVMSGLVLDLPSSTVSLEMMLYINCLLLFVLNLLTAS